MSSSNLEQLESSSSSMAPSMHKYGACIEEFNANISFGNSIKWCKDENYIAMQTNNTVYIKNVINEKRGTIVLNKESESEDGTVTTSQEPNRTSTHFKDRTVIHPSMFVRFLQSSFRSICWSSPIENYETFEITNEIGCLISCITSDNNCRIYKRPTQGYTTNWELVCDVRAILQDNDKILLSIENDNDVIVTPQGIITTNGLVNEGELITNKKTRNHVSKKTSSVMGLEQQFFSHFYKSFTDASGFDPTKQEYQVGYRKWTDEEQKIYDKVLESSLEYFKPQLEENSLSTESLTKNLYVKLRTKMRKDKEKGKLTDTNISSSTRETRRTSTGSTTEDLTQEDVVETPEKKRKESPSESQQPKKLKRLYFSRGVARAKDEEVNQSEYNHCLYITELMCSDFSQPFKKSIDGAFRQSLYMVCGSKTGFLSIFVITNFDRKLEVELVGYSKIFSNFISFVKFLPSRSGDEFFRIVVASCEGQIKILSIPKSYTQSIEKLDDLVTPKEICKEYSSYFESDSIPLTSLETFYVSKDQSKKALDEMYMCYSKGTNLYVCKFEFQDQETLLTWRKKFSCQNFTISSISMQYITIDRSDKENSTINTLLVYTTSLDGSLVQWKINEDTTDDGYTSVYIISKNFELPVWGCSLSPNNVQMAISVERPSTREVRADLEHRNKIRMYILPLYYHALRAIYHIPQTDPIPSHCIVDYFTTLLRRGIFRKQQAFDIADCLSSSDMVEYIEKILSNVYDTANNLPLKKILYFIYSWICREKSYPLRETLLERKAILEEELRYIYSVTLFDIQSKKQEKPNLTQYLLCDWILLYYQDFVAEHFPSNNLNNMTPYILQQVAQFLPILDSIIKTLKNEDNAEKNLKEIQFAQKLFALFTRVSNKEDHAASISNEIISETNFITPRDSCSVCKPTSEERFVPIVFGSQFSHATCCSTRKHPIARDGFTFEIIRDVYQMLECSCCCQQTSRDGLFSVLYRNCTQHNTTAVVGGEEQHNQPSEEVVVDENLMSLLCPSHKDVHIEACSFKIECCLCGSSFNAKV
ncbi:hypothetical protein NAEGRDRAFT_78786 [Naegleria gruberi]|uniref:Uncharacterized protein n=1 Tax=Naegleria gruberi TaxID=5762 RepID=D2V6I6_NAEGR|nr:uncharacterized protein NAEGRDRAFT_78786 [Naegleria gruberi]EFC47451.1 hypothetical protein NAEGRDRAFT_78786 [Naegleria gruberi]|eukprot:XP_002680195.1 hypothetical protein NAEGRDRAFT_78786 [Naegleria gruberi strain NEG-M]